MLIVLLGLAIFVFSALLLSLFFQLVKIEKELSNTVGIVEVYLLHLYGEIREQEQE